MIEDPKQALIEALRTTLDTAEWSWLAPHMKLGNLILVDAQLNLLETAYKVATDEKETIEAWIASGQLSKPVPSQIEQWEKNSERKFTIVIVQPYVLAQEYLLH